MADSKKRSHEEVVIDPEILAPGTKRAKTDSQPWQLVKLVVEQRPEGMISVSLGKEGGGSAEGSFHLYSDAFDFMCTHHIYFVPTENDLFALAKKTIFSSGMPEPALVYPTITVERVWASSAKSRHYNMQLKGTVNPFNGSANLDLVKVRYKRFLCHNDGLSQFNTDTNAAAPAPPRSQPVSAGPSKFPEGAR